MTFLTLLWAFFLCQPFLTLGRSTIIGYDCVNAPANFTPISLSGVVDCDPPSNIKNFEKVTIQLIQTKHFEKLHAIFCLLEVSTLIQHCGMHSHSSMAAEGLTVGDIQPIDYSDCYTLHKKGFYSVQPGVSIDGVKPNSTGVYPTIVAGRILTNEGKCSGGSYTSGSRLYVDVTVTKSYKITLKDEFSSVNTHEGTIHPSSGYTHKLKTDSGFDSVYGYGFWDSSSVATVCQPSSHQVLYEGVGYIHESASKERTLVINETKHAMAVGLRAATIVCNQHGYATEHPKLSIVVSTGGFFFFTKTPLIPENMDAFLYTNSKFVFIERHFGGQIASLYTHFREKLCDIRHRQLTHLISLAYISPEEFAWAYTKLPGYTAMIRGEVIYLMGCTAVSVEYRPTDLCYQELTVVHKNTSMFLKPKSRVLVAYGTEVDCNPLAPIVYKIGELWHSFNPKPVLTSAPLALTPNSNLTWAYQPLLSIGTSGLYSSEDLEEYQKRIMFNLEKPAIENVILRRSAGNFVHDQNLDVSHLLSMKSVSDMQDSLLKRLYGYYWQVCIQVAGFSGFIIILMAIKALLGMIINGSLLYKVYGCSFKVLTALWGTLAKHVLYFGLVNRAANNFNPNTPSPSATPALAIAGSPPPPSAPKTPSPIISVGPKSSSFTSVTVYPQL